MILKTGLSYRDTLVAYADNVADIPIKALFKPAFEELRTKLGLQPLELGQKVEKEYAGS